jgi:hypothetical protein
MDMITLVSGTWWRYLPSVSRWYSIEQLVGSGEEQSTTNTTTTELLVGNGRGKFGGGSDQRRQRGPQRGPAQWRQPKPQRGKVRAGSLCAARLGAGGDASIARGHGNMAAAAHQPRRAAQAVLAVGGRGHGKGAGGQRRDHGDGGRSRSNRMRARSSLPSVVQEAPALEQEGGGESPFSPQKWIPLSTAIPLCRCMSQLVAGIHHYGVVRSLSLLCSSS